MKIIEEIKETIKELKEQPMANIKAIERLEKKLKDLEFIKEKSFNIGDKIKVKEEWVVLDQSYNKTNEQYGIVTSIGQAPYINVILNCGYKTSFNNYELELIKNN